MAPQTPTFEEQQRFYDTWNASCRRSGFDQIEPESRARGERALALLRALAWEHPAILEVGCGTGWLTEKLQELGPTTGIDLSPAAIAIARQRHIGAEFVAGNFYETRFVREPFDVCVCLETIAYVPDQPAFVARLASVLRPGGYLVLSAVNKFVYDRRSDIGPPQPGQIRKWLARRELLALLKPHFRVLQTTTVLPAGDRGLMRLVQSHKLNRLLETFSSPASLRRAKEQLGFGQTRVLLARRLPPCGGR